ncbi:hypothetical protein EON65_02965 [archaeon]|nr:MAG: hypothetical protein EON65_02965 [archaeon]
MKEDKILLFRALKAAHNHSDVIYFGGKQVKAIFDTNNPHPHLLLHGKMLVKAWKTVAELINETYIAQKKHPATREYKAVYMHNEFPAGDFVLTVLEEYRRSKLLRFSKTPGVFNITRSQVFKSMDHYQPPVVITNAVDENWGFLSTGIEHITLSYIP